MSAMSSRLLKMLKAAGVRGALAAIMLVLAVVAASGPARAELSGEMQGAIADMINSAIATEDAQGLSDAINDLCAAHPDIKAQIVAAVAGEVAARRPPGFCADRVGPCVDLDSIMDTLLTNVLTRYDTASGGTRVFRDSTIIAQDNKSECGAAGCSPRVVEPPASSSSSPVRR